MSPLVEILLYLIQTAAVFYTVIVLLRFLMQLARADFYNPISQFIVKATNPPLLPLRRIVPGLWGLDMASLLLALLVQLTTVAVIILLYGGSLDPAKIFTWSLINCIGFISKIFFFSVLAGIILSWVAPHTSHPVAQLILQINEPIMRPFRKLLPAMGGFDFSPLFVFISLNVVNILLRHAAVSSRMYDVVSLGI